MKSRLKILIPIAAIIGLFSVIVPFSDIFSGDLEYIEDMIYWRGILLSIILFCIGSAAVLQSYFKIIVITIGFGTISLLITSSVNLFLKDSMNTENYFWFTIYSIGITLLIIMLIKFFGVQIIGFQKSVVKKIRLCWNKRFRGLRY